MKIKNLLKVNITNTLKHHTNESIYAINHVENKGFHNDLSKLCVEELVLKTNIHLSTLN